MWGGTTLHPIIPQQNETPAVVVYAFLFSVLIINFERLQLVKEKVWLRQDGQTLNVRKKHHFFNSVYLKKRVIDQSWCVKRLISSCIFNKIWSFFPKYELKRTPMETPKVIFMIAKASTYIMLIWSGRQWFHILFLFKWSFFVVEQFHFND